MTKSHRTTAQQLAAAEARLARLREQARREDTRRKILIGSMILGRAEADTAVMQRLLQELDGWLASGDRNRRLFLNQGLGSIQGLRYNTALHPVEQQPEPGWVFGRTLPPAAQSQRDRYGNAIDA